MDKIDIQEFFAPVIRVTIKRMFGGAGLYAEGLIFAFEESGAFYFKTDAENRAFFEDRGSKPFVFTKTSGEQSVMSYFSLPEAGYDDPELLRACVATSLAASRRAQAAKPGAEVAGKSKKPGKSTKR